MTACRNDELFHLLARAIPHHVVISTETSPLFHRQVHHRATCVAEHTHLGDGQGPTEYEFKTSTLNTKRLSTQLGMVECNEQCTRKFRDTIN